MNWKVHDFHAWSQQIVVMPGKPPVPTPVFDVVFMLMPDAPANPTTDCYTGGNLAKRYFTPPAFKLGDILTDPLP